MSVLEMIRSILVDSTPAASLTFRLGPDGTVVVEWLDKAPGDRIAQYRRLLSTQLNERARDPNAALAADLEVLEQQIAHWRFGR